MYGWNAGRRFVNKDVCTEGQKERSLYGRKDGAKERRNLVWKEGMKFVMMDKKFARKRGKS